MNIWTGLLFLEGAIADPALAQELAGDDATATDPAPRRTYPSTRNPEKTMNLFKGLLYLLDNDPPASPVLVDNRRFGAATAAAEFAAELGNRVASERWFGKARASDEQPAGCT
ncbi:hypothetical protein [Lysobacter fragariae]